MSDDDHGEAIVKSAPELVALKEHETALARALADPETLVQGLRYLQQRIPEFVQLSVREEQSMTRAAHLDPHFVNAGLHAAGAWAEAKDLIGSSGEELREQAEDVDRWDEVERELRALLKGVAAANLKRKHRLGSAILKLYSLLGIVLEGRDHLRPYYDDMKRAYRRPRTRRKSG